MLKSLQSVAQMLARKSVDKAKFVALTAARNKIINNVTHNEEKSEKSESVRNNFQHVISYSTDFFSFCLTAQRPCQSKRGFYAEQSNFQLYFLKLDLRYCDFIFGWFVFHFQYRFASTASLTSSGSNLNRLVAMTKSSSSSTVGTFTGTKTLASMPIKVPEEDEQKRKEHEMRRLREKEEEAARKREELIKAKAEEQKR